LTKDFGHFHVVVLVPFLSAFSLRSHVALVLLPGLQVSRSRWAHGGEAGDTDFLVTFQAPAPQYSLAALIQGVAGAVSHHLLEQASDCPHVVHQSVEFGELSLRQLWPAFRSTGNSAEGKK
jgi:hypothetical protein